MKKETSSGSTWLPPDPCRPYQWGRVLDSGRGEGTRRRTKREFQRMGREGENSGEKERKEGWIEEQPLEEHGIRTLGRGMW